MSDDLFSKGNNEAVPHGTIAMTDAVEQPTIQQMADQQEREANTQAIEIKWGDGSKYEFEEIEGFDPSRFNSVADVIKSNVGLRKKLSEKPEEAPINVPEEYEVDTERFDLEDNMLKQYTEIAREVGLSQEHYDKFLNMVHENNEQTLKAQQEAELEWKQNELKKLGPQAEERWTKINEWADKQGMPEEVRAKLSSNVKSADDVLLWEWALNKNFYSQPPAIVTGKHYY